MKNHSDNFDQWLNPKSSPEVAERMQDDWIKLNSLIASHDVSQKRKRLNTTLMWSAAAILILLVCSSIIWIQNSNYTTIKAPSNQELAYTLPDGSTIILSNGSKIRFEKSFENGERLVNLKGEAYFDVVSNFNDPFIVNTGEAMVQVTGTRFSVSAIKNSDEIAVQVNSGKVLFYNSETLTPDSFRVGLGAGDMGIYLPKLKQLNKQAISKP